MNWQTLWRHITSTRYSRELEREVLRERGEAVRLHEEVSQERAQNVRLREEVTRELGESARQRAAVARERTENARLRAENRALLNSILGIAGIPPVLADISAVEAVVPRAAMEMNRSSDRAADETAAESAYMDRDLILTNPDRPRSRTPRTGNTSDGFSQAELSAPVARERAAHQINLHEFPAHASASAESKGSSVEHPTSTRPTPDASRATQSARRPVFSRNRVPRVKSVFDKQQIATPTRRRSWHQINRQLELAAARKPATVDE